MKNTIGRPRTLTARQVQTVLAWHERFLAWKALRKTLKSQRQLGRRSESGAAFHYAKGDSRAARGTAPRDRSKSPSWGSRITFAA